MTLPMTQSTPDGPRLVRRLVRELRPHQSYAKLLGLPSLQRLFELERLGEEAYAEPLLVTCDGIVLDGHVRLSLARKQGRTHLLCLEYALAGDAEVLPTIIAHHRGKASTLNPFCRIVLALELEPTLRERARANQRLAGRKLLSNLTKDERQHVRREVARVAGVSSGNVAKVKQILQGCVPEVIRALKAGEISIHRAHGWRSLSPAEQKRALEELRFGKDAYSLIRDVLRKHRPAADQPHPSPYPDLDTLAQSLRRREDVRVRVLRRQRREVIVISCAREGPICAQNAEPERQRQC